MLDATDTPVVAPATMQRSHGAGTLAVKHSGGRSRIDRMYQSGNAKIRIPRTHGHALEAVLINTSGGITGGDTLKWSLDAGSHTHTIVTTQACERIYRSTGETGMQQADIRLGDGSSLFWLPQETILFDRGRFRRELDVTLSGNACFLGLEILVLGREAMGETVDEGRQQWVEIRVRLLTMGNRTFRRGHDPHVVGEERVVDLDLGKPGTVQ